MLRRPPTTKEIGRDGVAIAIVTALAAAFVAPALGLAFLEAWGLTAGTALTMQAGNA